MLKGHDVKTVQEAGWTGLKNGDLLLRASEGFGAFITVDRNLAFQQNLHELPMPVLVIHAPSNRLNDLVRYTPEILQLLQTNLTKTPHHIGQPAK